MKKVLCDKGGGGGGGGEEEEAGYRIKNKNPTQRCGEKRGIINGTQGKPENILHLLGHTGLLAAGGASCAFGVNDKNSTKLQSSSDWTSCLAERETSRRHDLASAFLPPGGASKGHKLLSC